MSIPLITTDPTVDYQVKEVGPILVALAFVIALGGVAAAAIAICGWRGAKNVGFDWTRKTVGFTCR